MHTLDFRETFFEAIVKSELGYKPWIVVAPSHMANGLFREIVGVYYNNEVQHRAINAKVRPVPDENDRFYKKYVALSKQEKIALEFMQANSAQRQILSQSFRADKTVFTGIGTSSYTLSHIQHTTNDNHDRDFGRWLTHVLQQGEERSAYELLHLLLTQGVTWPKQPADMPAMSDALSLMTLPLMEWKDELKQKKYDYDLPASLTYTSSGRFPVPLINTIRIAFDRLAENDRASAMRSGKLDVLRHMTTLACFSFYLHLINIGEQSSGKLPLLLYLERDSRTIKRASQESYRLARQSTDNFLYSAIKEKIEGLNEDGQFGHWDNQDDIQRHIKETINWYRTKDSKLRAKEKAKVDQLKVNCQNFYDSYRTTTNDEIDAISHALTDMVGMVFSETPATVARALGVKIGLLTRGDRRENKAYELHPDLLEVLVRATIPVGEEWPIQKLAAYWYEQFGILFGGLGDENQKLAEWEIAPIDANELKRNEQSLAQQLELSGYAQSYADGVVLVRVER